MRYTKRFYLAAASMFAMMAAASAGTMPGAVDHGRTDPAGMITVTVQMKLPDSALLGRTVDALYDRGSPTFHHWLSDADMQRFAPSVAQRGAVRAALVRNKLTIVSVSNSGFSIRARGTVADVSAAFGTELHEFDLDGTRFRAPIRPAVLRGGAGAYVSTVVGLDSHAIRPMVARALDMRTHRPYPAVKVSTVLASGGLQSMITDVILGPSKTFNYSSSGGPLPTATYSGITYNGTQTVVADYMPKQLQGVYGLNAAYKMGLDGTGQTVVLLEAYGYPTMLTDAGAFAKMTGLPALTGANLKVIYPEGKPSDPEIGVKTGWNQEIALDVEWAHAIAPGAKILVVASHGQNSEDFQAAMQYIIDNRLGNAVSDSWEVDTDAMSGPSEQESYEYVLLDAAAKGISFQFSTGDGGDAGMGTALGAPGVPSTAPHATAVGGTAILNNVGTTGHRTTGWGDELVFVDGGNPVDPPGSFTVFGGGGGGGESLFWPKPGWQKLLAGTGRQTPDVSALADPYTGVPIVIYDKYAKARVVLTGLGGTSLASPIFTAFWAIANQKAGHALGQAAPTIAGLTYGVEDVLPLTSKDSISGSVTDSNGTVTYSTRKLFSSVNPTRQAFIAPIWDQPWYGQAAGLGFGLDTSLTVGVGWDNETGYGTPFGLAFINAASAYK